LGEGGAPEAVLTQMIFGKWVAMALSVAAKLRRDRARTLRRNQTETETKLWDALRGGRLEDWKWRRQAPVGPYIVDFLCLEAALVVEVDGGVHAEEPEYDARRDALLKRRGLQVLRFGNAQVTGDFDQVCWRILSACRESDPARRGKKIDRRGPTRFPGQRLR